MKRFLTTATAIGFALATTAPLALAQPAPGQYQNHPNYPPNGANHSVTVQHSTTVTHSNTIVQNGHLAGQSGPAYQHPPAPVGYAHPPGFGNQGPSYEHQTVVSGHQWHRGDRYSGSRQVVTNWSTYHAQRPPAGYEYVRDGNNLVLIAIASGVVASVLANALYQ
jgi:Ni/Co efflux regulator RcnB